MIKSILRLQLFVIPALIFSCQSPGGKEITNDNEDTVATPQPIMSEEDQETVDRMISSISPPLEMSYIINDLDLNFSTDILSDAKSAQQFNSSLDQVAAMGIYGADLVYCLVYSRNDLAMKYLKAIHELSDALNLSNEIDFDKLEKLANENADPDQMASTFTMQLEHLHDHLSSSNRSELSAMLAFGGWVESIHLAEAASDQVEEPTEEMIELVYYEATLSNEFLSIFQKFNELPGHSQMPNDLENMISLLDEFEKNLTKVEPEVSQSEDMTTVIDLSTQELIYRPEQVAALKDQINSIRNGLLINTP